MDECLIAWFAGLFEGEGSIWIGKRSSVRLTIAMTDRDVLERADQIFPSPSGIRTKKAIPPKGYPGATLKEQYVWRTSDAKPVLEAILPYLGERRARKAHEALDHMASRGKLRSHCEQGHEFTEENTYLDRDGYRNCRTCSRMWSREYYAKMKAIRGSQPRTRLYVCTNPACGREWEGPHAPGRSDRACSDACRREGRRLASLRHYRAKRTT